MTNLQLHSEKTNPIINSNDVMGRFIDYLFINKKAIHIETAKLVGDSYKVEYCPEWTLNNGEPNWDETTITKSALISFVINNELNKWQSVSVLCGEVINTPQECDAETMLMDCDALELFNIIRGYMEKGEIYHA